MREMNTENSATHGATIKVWDIPVRVFHWALVLGFASAYLTAEFRFGDIHAVIGYALCVLLVVRVFWGFYGSQYARFSSFVFSPAETIAYMRSMFGKHPIKHYFGHNPAGALMVFALLVLLTLIFSTGLVTLGTIDFEGPFAGLANGVSDETSYAFRHIHELLTNVALGLIALHLMGVVGGSLQHGENLVRAMVTGRKMVPSHSGEVKSTKLDE